MRKSTVVTITAEGRDRGKQFLITEMSAMETEAWAARALLALGRSGMEISDEAIEVGAAAALVAAGISSFRRLAFDDAEPLLREMMQCVTLIPDPTKTDPATGRAMSRALIPDDIEEVSTLLKLRGEVLDLHLGFSVAAALSSWVADYRAPQASATPTSRKRSDRSSGGGSRRSKKSSPATD